MSETEFTCYVDEYTQHDAPYRVDMSLKYQKMILFDCPNGFQIKNESKQIKVTPHC